MMMIRPPLATVRLYHDEIFSLVSNEVVDGKVIVGDDSYDSLGEYRVTGKDGSEESRNKIQQTVLGAFTEVDISPDLVGTPTEFTHMAEFLLDRHAPGEHITGLFCLSGDDKTAKRLAAVMGVEFLTTEPNSSVAAESAAEPVADLEAPAPALEG